jgi:hypothetical protein
MLTSEASGLARRTYRVEVSGGARREASVGKLVGLRASNDVAVGIDDVRASNVWGVVRGPLDARDCNAAIARVLVADVLDLERVGDTERDVDRGGGSVGLDVGRGNGGLELEGGDDFDGRRGIELHIPETQNVDVDGRHEPANPGVSQSGVRNELAVRSVLSTIATKHNACY